MDQVRGMEGSAKISSYSALENRSGRGKDLGGVDDLHPAIFCAGK